MNFKTVGHEFSIYVIKTVRRRSRICETVECPSVSVCLSYAAIDSGVRRVCCWAPRGQKILTRQQAATKPQRVAQQQMRAVPRLQPRDAAELTYLLAIISALLDLRSRTVHNTRTELNWPSYTARLLVTRISVTTWRAAAKLGRLVFTQFVRYEQTLTVGRTQFLDLSVIMNGTLAAVHPVLTIYYQNNLTLLLYRVAQTNTNLLKYLDF